MSRTPCCIAASGQRNTPHSRGSEHGGCGLEGDRPGNGVRPVLKGEGVERRAHGSFDNGDQHRPLSTAHSSEHWKHRSHVSRLRRPPAPHTVSEHPAAALFWKQSNSGGEAAACSVSFEMIAVWSCLIVLWYLVLQHYNKTCICHYVLPSVAILLRISDERRI